MKKLLAMVVAFFVALTINQTTESGEEKNNQETAYWLVQSETSDGYLSAEAIGVEVEGGMILEDKYELGDIVSVTWDVETGDIISEYKVRGKELRNIEDGFGAEVNALMEEGIRVAGSY